MLEKHIRGDDSVSAITKATLLVVSSMSVMTGATLTPVLPSIKAAFGPEQDIDFLVKLILTLPALMIAVGAPFAGWIIDRWGRRRLLMFSVFLYGIAGGSGLLVDSLYGILAGRFFIGLAVAGTMTCATTLAGDYFNGHQRSAFVGYQGAFMSFGGIFYLLAGGFLAEYTWRAPFGVYLAAFVILLLVFFSIPEPVAGAGVEHTSEEENNHNLISAIFIVIFSLAFISMALFYMMPVQAPFLMESIIGDHKTLFGLAIAVSSLTAALSGSQYHLIKDRMSFLLVFSVVFIVMGFGYFLLGVALNYTHIIIPMVFIGLGQGLVVPNLSLWTLSETPERFRGRTVGRLNTVIFLGQFSSPILILPLTQSYGIAGAFSGASLFMLFLAVLFVFHDVRKRNSESRNLPVPEEADRDIFR